MTIVVKPLPDVLTVRVTAGDIRRGKQSDCFACPIGRAVSRVTGLRADVSDEQVDLLRSTIQRFTPVAIYRIPKAASTFIRRFDHSKKLVKPATFRLRRIP